MAISDHVGRPPRPPADVSAQKGGWLPPKTKRSGKTSLSRSPSPDDARRRPRKKAPRTAGCCSPVACGGPGRTTRSQTPRPWRSACAASPRVRPCRRFLARNKSCWPLSKVLSRVRDGTSSRRGATWRWSRCFTCGCRTRTWGGLVWSGSSRRIATSTVELGPGFVTSRVMIAEAARSRSTAHQHPWRWRTQRIASDHHCRDRHGLVAAVTLYQDDHHPIVPSRTGRQRARHEDRGTGRWGRRRQQHRRIRAPRCGDGGRDADGC